MTGTAMRRFALPCLVLLSACSASGGSRGVGFDSLSGDMVEKDALSLYKGKDWRCGETADDFRHLGQQVCGIGPVEFDGLKATNVALLFRDGKLASATVEYDAADFAPVAKALDAVHQTAIGNEGERRVWQVQDGLAFASTSARRDGHPFVIWNSAARAAH
jgi:hypothetical protein